MSAIAAAALSFCMPSSSKPSPPPPNPLTEKPTKSLIQRHPLYTQTHQFKEKILSLEIMGVDSGKALSQNPSLHAASLQSIQSVISYLQHKGIRQKDLRKIIGMCPTILTSSINTDLGPVFRFLSEEIGVPENQFRRVVIKCPRVLASSVTLQLKPALVYLQKLGFKDLKALAYHVPMLLASNVENTLIPKFECLQRLGFHEKDVCGMVLRCPVLLTFSVENNLKPKFRYFMEEMEGDLDELREFPQYFSFSLEGRIKPRHLESLKMGLKLPLGVFLKSTDEQFMGFINQSL